MQGCGVAAPSRLQNLPSLNDSDENQDDGYNEQNVNEASDGNAADEAEQPEDNEDDGDGVKHKIIGVGVIEVAVKLSNAE